MPTPIHKPYGHTDRLPIVNKGPLIISLPIPYFAASRLLTAEVKALYELLIISSSTPAPK